MAKSIIEILSRYNPKLRGDKFDLPKFKRDVLLQIKSAIATNKSVILYGPRSAGKTMAVQQFISSEDPQTLIISGDFLELRNPYVLRRALQEASSKVGKYSLFVDEPAYIRDWDKIFSEQNLLGIRNIFFSTSDKRAIDVILNNVRREKSLIFLLPLSMREALKALNQNVYEESRNLSCMIINSAKENSPKLLVDELRKVIERLSRIKGMIDWYVDFAVKYGSYPEVFFNARRSEIELQNLLRLILWSSIYADALVIHGVRMPHKLESLMYTISIMLSRPLSPTELAHTIGSRVSSIERYLSTLESMFLIVNSKCINNLCKGMKLYPIDPGIRNILLNSFGIGTHSMEILSVQHALRIMHLAGKGGASLIPKTYFYYGRSGTVDVIFNVSGSMIGLGLHNEKSFVNGLRELENEGVEINLPLFLTYKGKPELSGKIIKLPIYLFLLALP